MVKKITCLLTVGILPILFYVSSQKWLLIESPIFAANQIYRIMYSSEDLERFYFQYQTEALPHGESLQSFCVNQMIKSIIYLRFYDCFTIFNAVNQKFKCDRTARYN